METEALPDALKSLVGFEGTTTASEVADADLDRDAFLRLFLTQLENQDPLNPQDATEMSAQLATFSQLEQSTAMADELRGVNQRLDDLLAAAQGGSDAGPAALSVGLIGKTVEIAGNTLSRTPGRASEVLRFSLESADSENFRILARDGDGNALGIASFALSDGEGRTLALPQGEYALYFPEGAGQPRLRFPDGEEVDLSFGAADVDEESGHWFLTPEGGDVDFVPGAYDFGVEAIGGGDRSPLQTRYQGVVDAVRVEEGAQKVVIDGLSIDPTNIILIR